MENTAHGDPSHNSQFQVLVDSDAFVGRAYPDDAHHHQASQVFQSLKTHQLSLVTTSLVVVETATVLSHRGGQGLATLFLNEVIKGGGWPVIHITEELQEEALTLFQGQTKKGSSVTDCANVAVVRRLNIPTIFSFDQVYPKKFGLPLARI